MRRTRRRPSPDAFEDSPAHDRWLLSYADFVTLLLAVFIALFGFSRGQKQSIRSMSDGIHTGFQQLALGVRSAIGNGSPINTEVQPGNEAATGPLPFSTSELKQQLEGVLGDAINKDEIVVQQTSEGLIISLRDFGFFNSGEAKLLPGAAEQLKRTAAVLMQHGLELRVEGHSDDQPIHTGEFRSNWELSTARATSVLTLMVDQAGYPPTKISVAGYAAYRPVADNATPEGRKKNRRVDLVIVEPKKKVETPQQ